MSSRILPIVLIVLSGFILFGYVNPTYSGVIATDQQQIASDNNALQAAAKFTDKENTLLQQEKAISPTNMARLASYLPDGVDNIQLILDLNALASRSGISLSGFTIQSTAATSQTAAPAASSASATQAKGTTAPVSATAPAMASSVPVQSTSLLGSITLSVTAMGTYPAFQTFLAATEQSLRPLDITQLTLKDATNGVYSYTITYRIYWLQ
jgi:hypothetical protein